jgi:predicted RNA-binding protein
MCEASAYVVREGEERLLMESVDIIRPEGDGGYRLISIFGEQKLVRGRIVEMNLVNHRILFEEGTD